MKIIKFKKTINRQQHIFTLCEDINSPNNGLYISNRDSEFVYRLEEFFVMDGVKIWGVNDGNNNIIINETYLNDEIVDDIMINDLQIIAIIHNGDEYNLEDDDYSVSQRTTQSTTNTTLESIQERIIRNNNRPIRLERILRNRRETPKQFLIKFFKGDENIEAWNQNRNTIFADDQGGIQTASGKRRSMGDIYMIMRYYYPDITLKQVAQLLYIDLINELADGLSTSNCNQINKRVWYYDEDEGGSFMEASQRDEYGNNKQFYINALRY